MVKVKFTLIILSLSVASHAFSLFEETAEDLQVLEDALLETFPEDSSKRKRIFPLLVATPLHHWKESRDDFGDSILSLLTRAFPGEKIIDCPDCDTYRLHVKKGNRTQINNGMLSLADFSYIKKMPQYREARAFISAKETPSGISVKIVSLDDGQILYAGVSDSSKTLDSAQPWFGFQREYQRRQREESLAFARFDLGFVPQPLLQLHFMEHWGTFNQHITGVSLSAIGPTAALGVSYHYLIPKIKRLDPSISVYFPLQNLGNISNDQDTVGSLVAAGTATYVIGDSYGIFLSVWAGGEAGASLGITLYNPLLLPFLL